MSGRTQSFAHSSGSASRAWEPLEEHLQAVSSRARQHCAAFSAESWGRAAGLWHDLGKYSQRFQEYLRAAGEQVQQSGAELPGAQDEFARGRVDHSTAGAVHAQRQNPRYGRMLAYVIAGHHAGLADRGDPQMPGTITARLEKRDPVIADALARAPEHLLNERTPELPQLNWTTVHEGACGCGGAFSLAFFTRMVFSALVDADYLATEDFVAPERASPRRVDPPGLRDLAGIIESEIARLGRQKLQSAGEQRVMESRAAVARDCAAAAERAPGFFTLTVPTGGGKTLSSMLLALRHAARHDLRRVIVAVPFTSIIDQNAAVYSDLLGASTVLEHHSNLDPRRETTWRALASQNWDAPVIVTTTVQLFESLYASRSAACRKLHNLARSVIVLDEVQALPPHLLAPILACLRELVANYGCSIVLSTATQPALARRDRFELGLPYEPRHEIIRDVPALFAALKRTQVRSVGPRSDPDVIQRLMRDPSALAIVNTRRHAAALFKLLQEKDSKALHLSALMCPAHRAIVLAKIRQRLVHGADCRLVSTQVIEAGVDVDFGFVMRALAGLDSIAQSAGRCNRGGRHHSGKVEVFIPDSQSEGQLPEAIRRGRDAAQHVLEEHADDLLGQDAIRTYFDQLYMKRGSQFDTRRVLECFALAAEATGEVDFQFDFKTASERFMMIDGGQQGVVVPFKDEGRRLVNALMQGQIPDRDTWKALQRFSVNVYQPTLRPLLESGVVKETPAGVLALADARAYDPHFGLDTDVAAAPSQVSSARVP